MYRKVKAGLVRLLRHSQRKVEVPILGCVLILMLVFMINMEIRKLESMNAGLSSESLSDSMHVEGDASSLRYSAKAEAMASIEGVVNKRYELQGEDVPASHPKLLQRAPSLTGQNAAPDVQVGGGQDVEEGEVDALAQILEMRIAQASGGVIGTRSCQTLAAMNNTRGTCVDTTCPHHLHPSARTRIRQLLNARFRLTPRDESLINNLARDVVPKKYLFATAASSNHYNESQALVFNLRKYVFSKLHKDSYSFLYFDLGLKPRERRRVEKNCNCKVMSINLRDFPQHTRKLMCYAWKTFIIKALLPKAEVLVYMDTSIRFKDMDLEAFFATAKRWGAQFLATAFSIPTHTVQSMFDFYRLPVCVFWPFPELLAGFSVFHNEPFMRRVVVDPWVSCALNKDCMCPVDPHAFRICPHLQRRVGDCHRFDLSSLTLQMALLYGHKFGHLVIQNRTRPMVVRDDKMFFFTD